MTKMITILAGASLAPVLLLAQTAGTGSAFQHAGWLATPATQHQIRNEGQQGPVSGKPFSGTEVRKSVQTLADGTRVEKSDSSPYYRDDKGRARSEGKNIAMIFDPAGGFNYQLDLRAKTYTKTPVDAKATYAMAVIGDGTWVSSTSGSTAGNHAHGTMENIRIMNGHRVVDPKPAIEDLQSQVINGVLARGSRITTTIPMGAFGNDREVKVVNERWSSDDLRVLVKSANSDPRFGMSTYELINVVQGSPDQTLFMVPAGFTEKAATHPMNQQHPANHHD